MAHALIVDDSSSTVQGLKSLCELEGFTTSTALSIDQARMELVRRHPSVALLDLNLPDGNGLGLIDSIRARTDAAVVLITGRASVDTAIEALRHRVTDYLTKPVDVGRLQTILRGVRDGRSTGVATARPELPPGANALAGIVGRSEGIRRACEAITQVAPSDASVLITGESGTGKEVVAQAIHALSPRRDHPCISVNCGAISPSLMESELFGHERGSFTGAERRHRGLFEQAAGGTLFLDEITEMPVELQVRLLRALEARAIVRVGGEESIPVDVRIIAASNRPPRQAIEGGHLRADLYYRIKVFHIDLPPLRARPEDVEPLARAFLDELSAATGQAKSLDGEALEALHAYHWPGNVRELRNAVHAAHVLAKDVIDRSHLPLEIREGEREPSGAGVSDATTGDRALTVEVGSCIADVERRLILATLSELGSKTKTAAVLGISVKTLYNRLADYGSRPR